MTAIIAPSQWGYSLTTDGTLDTLVASCNAEHLAGTVRLAHELDMGDIKLTVRARDLREGMHVDLAGDKYATMIPPNGGLRPDVIVLDETQLAQVAEDHDSTVNMFDYEYGVVESIEVETPECIVVHTSLTSFGCPPAHPVKVDPESLDSITAAL